MQEEWRWIMTGSATSVSRRWQEGINLSGLTTASLLVVFLVSTGVGAFVGLALAERVDAVLLAVFAGFAGTVVAGIARNTLLVRAWGVAGIRDVGTPTVVVVYAAVASLAGSLSAYHLAAIAAVTTPVLIGALAGVLASALFGLLIVTYRMAPDESAIRM
jgi:hypothetical protein